jgi:hypothetical protein
MRNHTALCLAFHLSNPPQTVPSPRRKLVLERYPHYGVRVRGMPDIAKRLELLEVMSINTDPRNNCPLLGKRHERSQLAMTKTARDEHAKCLKRLCARASQSRSKERRGRYNRKPAINPIRLIFNEAAPRAILHDGGAVFKFFLTQKTRMQFYVLSIISLITGKLNLI